MSDAIDPAANAERDLITAVASHCDGAAWVRFVPALAHMGMGLQRTAGGSPVQGAGVWVPWLSTARPGVQVRAQRLLDAMSRHRWRIEVAPPSSPDRASPERLRVLISVRGRAWVAVLAAVPHIHVIALEAVVAVRA